MRAPLGLARRKSRQEPGRETQDRVVDGHLGCGVVATPARRGFAATPARRGFAATAARRYAALPKPRLCRGSISLNEGEYSLREMAIVVHLELVVMNPHRLSSTTVGIMVTSLRGRPN